MVGCAEACRAPVALSEQDVDRRVKSDDVFNLGPRTNGEPGVHTAAGGEIGDHTADKSLAVTRSYFSRENIITRDQEIYHNREEKDPPPPAELVRQALQQAPVEEQQRQFHRPKSCPQQHRVREENLDHEESVLLERWVWRCPPRLDLGDSVHHRRDDDIVDRQDQEENPGQQDKSIFHLESRRLPKPQDEPRQAEKRRDGNHRISRCCQPPGRDIILCDSHCDGTRRVNWESSVRLTRFRRVRCRRLLPAPLLLFFFNRS